MATFDTLADVSQAAIKMVRRLIKQGRVAYLLRDLVNVPVVSIMMTYLIFH